MSFHSYFSILTCHVLVFDDNNAACYTGDKLHVCSTYMTNKDDSDSVSALAEAKTHAWKGFGEDMAKSFQTALR